MVRQQDLNYLNQAIIEIFPSIETSTIDFFLHCCVVSSQDILKQKEFSIDKPYGSNHILLMTEFFGISFAQIKPRHGTSYHYHSVRKEFFFVKSGILTLIKEKAVTTLAPLGVENSNPFERHCLKNSGKELLEILEIFSPPLLNDKVRVKDEYRRKLGGVNYLE